MFNQKTIDNLTDRLNEVGNENLKLCKILNKWDCEFIKLLKNLNALHKLNALNVYLYFWESGPDALRRLNESFESEIKNKNDKDKITKIVKEILDKKDSE